MSPNNFVLRGSGVEVNYTLGTAPGFPELRYTDGAFQKILGPNQIQINDTGLGELVSVPLILSVDTGGQGFGFFLPLVSIDASSQTPVHFHTVGVYETFSGPFSAAHRPSAWRCIEMRGTAQMVPVPI